VRPLISLVAALSVIVPAALVAQRATKPAPKPAAKPAAPASAPRVEKAVPFAVGETLTYDVSWSGYLTAGTAVLSVKEKKPSYNSTAYYLVAEGQPTSIVAKLYTLYYKMDSLLDSFTLLSQRGSLYSQEGKRRRFQTTVFDRAANIAHFEMQTSSVAKEDLTVAAGTQDVLATIYALRAAALKTGDRINVAATDRGNLYSVRFDVGAVERVSVPMGAVDAWKIGVTITDEKQQRVGNNLAMWITNDARRLPVQLMAEMKVGSFRLSLRSATHP